ncbi:MAG: L-threonine ammonia-lyase [Myxococcales bacterium]|nr:L-threonine ammonia-lyase [Myxococcales bacterium]
MSDVSFVGLADVQAARDRIRAHVRVTPVVRWQNDIWLKLEQLQMGGSFKARGACNRVFAADEKQLKHGVVTASGGNHGLGVAYAASRHDVPATIYLPERAPQSTERRMRELGATVERHGRDWDDAWAVAQAHATRTGALLVHPFEDAEVIAGQGTIALELLEQLGKFDTVVVAIGGGGLIGGIAMVLKSLAPSIRVVGVEPTGATAMKDSMAAGKLVALASVDTIAGTLAPRAVGPHTLALASKYVDEVVLVSDAELKAAMRTLWSELRVLVEPAGAAAVAAVATRKVDTREKRVAVLVCGANLDTTLAAEALA